MSSTTDTDMQDLQGAIEQLTLTDTPLTSNEPLTDSSIKQEVKRITNDYKSLLTIEDAMRLGLHKGPGNGSGPRNKITRLFINTTIYGENRPNVTYPLCFNETIEIDEQQNKLIQDYKIDRKNKVLPCKGVIGFIIQGDNDEKKTSRPIRKDIKQFYLNKPCIKCGSKKTICDHKNDLYNDPRVLDIKTQTKEDFQPLCNSCNLRKRAVSLKRDKEKKRQPPTLDVLTCNGGIKFTKGDETYDPRDPNALIGTYWYDPIQFGMDCIKMNSMNQINYYKC